MQTISKFTWNLSLGTLILAPLNWQTVLRQSRCGWEINLNLIPDKTEFIEICDDKIRNSMKSSFPVRFLGNIMEPAEKSVKTLVSSLMLTGG